MQHPPGTFAPISFSSVPTVFRAFGSHNSPNHHHHPSFLNICALLYSKARGGLILSTKEESFLDAQIPGVLAWVIGMPWRGTLWCLQRDTHCQSLEHSKMYAYYCSLCLPSLFVNTANLLILSCNFKISKTMVSCSCYYLVAYLISCMYWEEW